MSLSIEALLTAHYHQFLDLEISPDDQATLIVFGNYDLPHKHYSVDEMNRSIWKLSFDGSSPVQLTAIEEDGHVPKWSPDGNRIAYFSRISGQTEIWVMDADGKNKRQITSTVSTALNPFDRCTIAWSPDGSKIVYTIVPNGSKRVLADKHNSTFSWKYQEHLEQIVVYSDKTPERLNKVVRNPPGFEFAIQTTDLLSGETSQVWSTASNISQPRWMQWLPGTQDVVVQIDSELKKIDSTTGTEISLCTSPFNLLRISDDYISIARKVGSSIQVGNIEENNFILKASVDIRKDRFSLSSWSHEGSKIYGTVREGVTNALIEVDCLRETVTQLTPKGKTAGEPKAFRGKEGIIFSFGGPSEPSELWKREADRSTRKVSNFNRDLTKQEVPEVRIIQYASHGWSIEALLVLPLSYVKGKKYPTLVFLHGGPESYVSANFTDLISARAESAAHYLASHGYAVLLPNFRGSRGYGKDFEYELADYQMMNAPFQDVIAGIDYLIQEEIADADALGIYGTSFGAYLTAWSISQTSRFKGAMAALGKYDFLHDDRASGFPFHTLRPNRQGKANPIDIWLRPEVYDQISSIEHVKAIKTPTLIVESGAERQIRGTQAKLLLNALRALEIESYLVYYPKAYHNGGWNDKYKEDYMRRLLAWFDHCLKGKDLPAWFDPPQKTK